MRELVDEIRTVPEEALARALVLALERAKLVVEPAGAAGIAALMEEPTAFEPPVVVVVSGGNIDPLVLLRVIRHGLTAAGRYFGVRVTLADSPGALAKLLMDVAAMHANVVEVEHLRTEPGLHVDEVDVELQLETRGVEHRSEVLAGIAALGYQVAAG